MNRLLSWYFYHMEKGLLSVFLSALIEATLFLCRVIVARKSPSPPKTIDLRLPVVFNVKIETWFKGNNATGIYPKCFIIQLPFDDSSSGMYKSFSVTFQLLKNKSFSSQ